MKILLPIDGPDDAELILGFVLKYQWPKEVEFKILHVIGSSKANAEAKRSEEKGRLLVRQMAERLQTMVKSAAISQEVRFGAAIYEIVDAAMSWDSQMIVMGYRTRAQSKPFLTGSVANGVASVAPCSVAIIRPEKSIIERDMNAWVKNLAEITPRRKTTSAGRTKRSQT